MFPSRKREPRPLAVLISTANAMQAPFPSRKREPRPLANGVRKGQSLCLRVSIPQTGTPAFSLQPSEGEIAKNEMFPSRKREPRPLADNLEDFLLFLFPWFPSRKREPRPLAAV